MDENENTKKLVCHKCGKEFDNIYQLGGHLKAHKMNEKKIKEAIKLQKKAQKILKQAYAENPEITKSIIVNGLEQDGAASNDMAENDINSDDMARKRNSKNEGKEDMNESSEINESMVPPPPPDNFEIPQNIQRQPEPNYEQPKQTNPNVDATIQQINKQLAQPLSPEELLALKQKLDNNFNSIQNDIRMRQQMLRAQNTPIQPQVNDGVTNILKQIDWNSLAQIGMQFLTEMIRERRLARMQPSLAEQVGMLAIENFAKQLSLERGRALGKKVQEVVEEPEEEPVQKVMLDLMKKQLEKEAKERQELAENYDRLLKEIENLKNYYNKRIDETLKQSEVKDNTKPQVENKPEETQQSEVKEEPQPQPEVEQHKEEITNNENNNEEVHL